MILGQVLGEVVATQKHPSHQGRKIRWNPETEEIVGDAEISKRLERPYRKPWDAVLRSFHL